MLYLFILLATTVIDYYFLHFNDYGEGYEDYTPSFKPLNTSKMAMAATSTNFYHQWLVPNKLLTSRRCPIINWLPSLLNHQLVKLPWVLWAAYYAVPILNEGTMNQGDPDYIVHLLFLLCNCLTNLYFSLCWVCTIILSIFLLIPLCLKKFLQDNIHS